MAVVSSVSDSPAVGFAGQLADAGNKYVRSYVNEETSAIPFGIGLMRGTAADDALLLTAVTDLTKFIGVAVHSHAYENQSLTGTNGVDADTALSVVRTGAVWVDCEETVAIGDPVYVRFVVNAGTEQVGAFRKSLDSNTCVQLKGATFLSGGSSTVPALLYLSGTEDRADSPFAIPFSNGSTTADATTFLYEVPADRFAVLLEATYYNETGLAEDVANFFNIKIQDATPTVAANWSTETGEEGTIAADTPVTLTQSATLANTVFVPGERINLMLDEDGTATLPAGSGFINIRLI